METQVYKVRDPSGNLREIRGPVGASDADVIAQAKRLFAADEPFVGTPVQPDIQPMRPAPAPALRPQEELPGPRQPSFGGYVREMIGPTVEAAGAIGGGLIGAPLGPAGAIGGAGLGYGIARQGLRLVDELRGAVPVQPLGEAMIGGAKDVATGATMEAGGRVVGDLLMRGASALKNLPRERAVKLVTESLKRDKVSLDDVTQALQNAPKNMLPAEALANAGIKAPATQALLSRGAARDPGFVSRMLGERADIDVNMLAQMAGGGTQTAARETQEQAVRNLSQLTEPQKRAALARANLGVNQLGMARTAEQARAEAAGAVEDVRRFTRAGTEAAPRVQAEISAARFPGQPRTPFRASYMSDLAQRADDVATAAAQQSLDAGAVARANESAVRTLQAYGIKPLTPAPVIEKIRAQMNNVEVAGNKPLEAALGEVEQQLLRWTGANGVIDARALDAIRKNAINSIALQFSQGNPTLQKQIAGDLTSSLKPTLIKAIEDAGGTGYAKYLADYSAARQVINQKQLGSVALDLLKNNKKGFIELVEGNSPETVEKVFGPGSYNIAKEMSEEALATLKGITATERAALTTAKEATEGATALREILQDNLPKYRLPPFFSAKITAMNQALDKLESKIGKNTMEIITRASQSGATLDDLLRELPSGERARVEKLFGQLRTWVQPAATATAVTAGPVVSESTREMVSREVNHLRQQPNQNSLAR